MRYKDASTYGSMAVITKWHGLTGRAANGYVENDVDAGFRCSCQDYKDTVDYGTKELASCIHIVALAMHLSKHIADSELSEFAKRALTENFIEGGDPA